MRISDWSSDVCSSDLSFVICGLFLLVLLPDRLDAKAAALARPAAASLSQATGAAGPATHAGHVTEAPVGEMEAAVEPLTAGIPVKRNGHQRLLARRELYTVRALEIGMAPCREGGWQEG